MKSKISCVHCKKKKIHTELLLLSDLLPTYLFIKETGQLWQPEMLLERFSMRMSVLSPRVPGAGSNVSSEEAMQIKTDHKMRKKNKHEDFIASK